MTIYRDYARYLFFTHRGIMDKGKLQWLLKDHIKEQVIAYANYCYKLTTETDKDWKLKNFRASKITEEKFAELYEKVNQEWLVFDGVHITLQSTGVSYDYVALKNKMLLLYPESVIDVSLVYEWDKISFAKDSWSITYSHTIADPFKRDEKLIIGAYVVIKNKRGEFLTTLNKEELEKHRKTAKTDYIWKQWYAEMCLKTIMKKACKLHFGDVFTAIEEQDNESYSLDNPLWLDIKYKGEIDAIKTIEELKDYYSKNKGKGSDFDKYVSIRKEQLLSTPK